MLTDRDLTAIRERCTQATPGPWQAEPLGEYEAITDEHGNDLLCGPNRANDAAFMVHAKTDILTLLYYYIARLEYAQFPEAGNSNGVLALVEKWLAEGDDGEVTTEYLKSIS